MSNQIEQIHSVQLDLLKKFREVCQKLNLRYTLSSGSMLGAVRHGGFIPWDDDIDVAMPRPDYEVLVKRANDLLPNGYFLEHYSTEKDCPNVFAKLKNSNTTWLSYEYRDLDINHGIGMDIFPIDRVKDPQKLNKIAKKTFILILLKNCCDINYIKTIKRKHKKLMAYLIMPFAKLMGRRRLLIKMDKFNKKYEVGEWTTGDVILRNKLMPYDLFAEYEDVDFENDKFSCIKNRDGYLSVVYGKNYMELPPEEKRVVHIVETVDCDKSFQEYLKTQAKKGA